MRCDSMTKKLMNCSTSSKRRSSEALGMVKYVRGLNCEVNPLPTVSCPASSAVAVTTTPLAQHTPTRLDEHTAQGHPQRLENIADDVEVSGGEDEGNGGGEGNGRGAGVLPLSKFSGRFGHTQAFGTYAEQPVEHAVVMGQRLTRRGWLFWCCPSICEISELALRLFFLGFGLLGDGACNQLALATRSQPRQRRIARQEQRRRCTQRQAVPGVMSVRLHVYMVFGGASAGDAEQAGFFGLRALCRETTVSPRFWRVEGREAVLTSPLLTESLRLFVAGWFETAAIADCAAASSLGSGGDVVCELQIRLIGVSWVRSRQATEGRFRHLPYNQGSCSLLPRRALHASR